MLSTTESMLEQSRYALEHEAVCTALHLFQEWKKAFRATLPQLPPNSEYALAHLVDTPLAQGLHLQQELDKILSRCERLMVRLLGKPLSEEKKTLEQDIDDQLQFEVENEIEKWCYFCVVDSGDARPLYTAYNMNLIESKFPEYRGDAEAEWKTEDEVTIEKTGRVLCGKSNKIFREYIVTFSLAGQCHVQSLYSTAENVTVFYDNYKQRNQNRLDVARQLIKSEDILADDENVMNMMLAIEYLSTIHHIYRFCNQDIVTLTLHDVESLHHIITGDTMGISPYQKITTFKGQLKEYDKVEDMEEFREHLQQLLNDLNKVKNCINMSCTQFGECEPLARILAKFCNAFLNAHPFADGNGRVCKLICCHVIQIVTQHLFSVFDEKGLLNYDRWCTLLMNGEINELTRAFQIEIHRSYHSCK